MSGSVDLKPHELLGSAIDRRLNDAKFGERLLGDVVRLKDPLHIVVSQTDQFPLNYDRLEIGRKSGKQSVSFIWSNTNRRTQLPIFCDSNL